MSTDPLKPVPKQAAARKYLDSILPQRAGEREVAGGFKMLAHDRIAVREQVRRTFPQADMDELRASIHELRAQKGGIEGTGLLQALLVSPARDESGATSYRLIAGERRFRATRDEGLTEVPCIIIPSATESVVRLMQLSENALRTTPPVLEEARAIRDTMGDMQLSLRDMARMLGKSLGYVTERVGLLKMGEDVQQMVFARANTLRHARLIDPIQDAGLRAELITSAIEGAGEREIRRRAEQTPPEIGPPMERAAPSAPSEVDESQTPQVFARANTSHIELAEAPVDLATSSKAETSVTQTARLDLTEQLVEPAVVLLAQAVRQQAALATTDDSKQRLSQALAQAKEHIAQLEKSL